jgi:lipopolysaccharide/colanic/teichoic acid biosynthesis glycosyltransferase
MAVESVESRLGGASGLRTRPRRGNRASADTAPAEPNLLTPTTKASALANRSFVSRGPAASSNDTAVPLRGERGSMSRMRSRRIELGLKRGLDLFGALALLAVLAPTLGAVALLVRLIDGRPVLFRQQRAGAGGAAFTILKFRTMEKGADELRESLRDLNEIGGNGAFKLTRDPRITRLGRILRKTSLDELPQLINVVRGDMSLVGPRPHPFDDVARYDAWHHERLAMKPGITGLWQVSGRSDTEFDRWVMLDLEYIHGWSLALDLRILAKTPRAVLRGEGR